MQLEKSICLQKKKYSKKINLRTIKSIRTQNPRERNKKLTSQVLRNLYQSWRAKGSLSWNCCGRKRHFGGFYHYHPLSHHPRTFPSGRIDKRNVLPSIKDLGQLVNSASALCDLFQSRSVGFLPHFISIQIKWVGRGALGWSSEKNDEGKSGECCWPFFDWSSEGLTIFEDKRRRAFPWVTIEMVE